MSKFDQHNFYELSCSVLYQISQTNALFSFCSACGCAKSESQPTDVKQNLIHLELSKLKLSNVKIKNN
ncbi:hypothetical protein T4C_13006 [Trichinella pseudospiralis]|uniref:Uncharacterized protein n=1 Tax=Trichinella pseudospiralis TaxID=6337 RepID=A0A0V1JQQ8_TRIPS|nr:hypothetical protein T4C_13006 [Trichinella pseudospiralis]